MEVCLVWACRAEIVCLHIHWVVVTEVLIVCGDETWMLVSLFESIVGNLRVWVRVVGDGDTCNGGNVWREVSGSFL